MRDHRNRAKGLLIGRLLLVSLCLGLGSVVFPNEQKHFYLIIGTYYLVTICFLIIFKTLKSERLLSAYDYLHLSFDIGMITWIVHETGGVQSLFSFLYILLIIAAGALLSSLAAIYAATASSLAYMVLVILEFFGILPMPEAAKDVYNNTALVVYLTNLKVPVFVLIGFLAASVSKRLAQSQKQVEDLQGFYGDVLKSISSGILVFDLQGKVLFFNQAAKDMLDLSQNSTSARLMFSTSPSLWSTVRNVLEQKTMSIERGEDRLHFDSAPPMPIGFSFTPLLDRQGSVKGKIMVFVDLTERKLLEERLRQKDRLSAVGELSARIAHEIRNPLASISGSVEVLQENLQLEGNLAGLLDSVVHESDRLNGILTRFLASTKTEKRQANPIAMNAFLKSFCALLNARRDFQDKMSVSWSCPKPCSVYADEDQLKQVFYNLALNALEAIESTIKRKGHLQIAVSCSNMRVKIDFKDDGPGMPEEVRLKVCQPFFTTKQKGTGLGLAVVYKVIEDHEGEMIFDSQPGEGTTVSIELPGKEE